MQSEGKLFHTRGPTTAKLRVPSTVLGLGTTRHLIQLNVNSRLITQQAQGFTEFTSLLLCALNCRQMQGMLISQAQLWALLSFAAGRRRVVVDPMLQPISLHISQPVPLPCYISHMDYGVSGEPVNNLVAYAFQQCKHFENRLRYDKVTDSLKVGTFLRHGVFVEKHID